MLKSFIFLANLNFGLKIVTKINHGRCFVKAKTDYRSWIFYLIIIDLCACFYEKYEIYSLKLISISSVSLITIYIIIHWIIFFGDFKR